MRVNDLDVYQRLFKLALEAHNISLTFPKFELFELGSQFRRSSNAAPANLAEGFGNKHTNIFTETISRSQGEIRETTHHARMSHAKKYITLEKLDFFVTEYEICSKMLYSLEKSLINKKKT